ncbi:kinase-like protein, partial [Gymnopus androsaceus JB14]
ILCGLRYLHTRRPPVVHGDLKGANILISDSGKCCLADFGLASITSTLQSLSSSTGSPRGSVRWMAPELLDYEVDTRPSKPTDMYAFGCTIFEASCFQLQNSDLPAIITGAPPFSNLKSDVEVSLAVLRETRPPRPADGFSNGLWTAVMNLWMHSAQDRPTVKTFMKNLQS